MRKGMDKVSSLNSGMKNGMDKVSSLNSASLTFKPLASSVYMHVP